MERQDPPALPLAAPAHVPPEWWDVRTPTLVTTEDCSTALRTSSGAAWVPRADLATEPSTAFAGHFWEQLEGPAAHVLVEYPPETPAVLAATLVATWMGLRTTPIHEDIGGTVSHVVSGAGHRHDQSWHTDSTAWALPNRYSVLGLIAGTRNEEATTDLLPIDTLHGRLADDPAALQALRCESLPWRRNFPHLPQLAAPVLDSVIPRWVWPVLERLLDEMSTDLRRGVLLIADLVNTSGYYAPSVEPGQLLVFDNRRALHRGPRLEATSGRELVRIKVDGKALP